MGSTVISIIFHREKRIKYKNNQTVHFNYIFITYEQRLMNGLFFPEKVKNIVLYFNNWQIQIEIVLPIISVQLINFSV